MLTHLKRAATLLAAAGLIAACGDGTGPLVLNLETVDQPTTIAAGETGELVARVLRGNQGYQHQVTFTPAPGSGTVASPVVNTDADGYARTHWQAGTTAGTQTVTVDAYGADPVHFQVQVVAGAPFAVRMAQDSARLFALGDETTFDAWVEDRWGNRIEGQALTWESRDPSVATVQNGGVVRAHRVGTAEIVARSGNLSASLFLRVVQAPATLDVSPDATEIYALSFQRQLTLRSWDAQGNPIPRPEADWTSLDESVATVDQTGLVTATGVGTTQIVATAGAASDTVTVTVSQAQASVELTGDPVQVVAGQTMTVSAIARDSAGYVIPNAEFTWAIEGDDGTDGETAAFTIVSQTPQQLTLRGEVVGGLNVRATRQGMTAEMDARVVLPRLVASTTVAAGALHTITIRNGQIYTFGRNNFGQLGDGSTDDRLIAMPLAGMTGFVAVSAIGDFSLALRNDGTVWGWGRNNYGQLGEDPAESVSFDTPRQIPGLSNIVDISAGGAFSGFTLALDAQGRVWSFGRNNAGQLGHGDRDDRWEPTMVEGVDGVVKVQGGEGTYSLALREDGSLWGWGTGTGGRRGDGQTAIVDVPVESAVLRRVVDIAAGNAHGFAIRHDGQLWAFGGNTSGATGTGAAATQPAMVPGMENTVMVRAGQNHSIAMTADGILWAWGHGFYGQIGNGTTTSTNNFPLQVSTLTNAITFDTGGHHVIAVGPDGTHWAWGRNSAGQLSTGDLTNRTEPVHVWYP
jgi:alpha-tubulin suppressor-like RCC1 family protein